MSSVFVIFFISKIMWIFPNIRHDFEGKFYKLIKSIQKNELTIIANIYDDEDADKYLVKVQDTLKK